MNYYIIKETNWAKLRDEILSLAEYCYKAFGEKSKHTVWLYNGDVCRLLNISKRTLQHYRDTVVLSFYANRTQMLLQARGCGSTSSYEAEQI